MNDKAIIALFKIGHSIWDLVDRFDVDQRTIEDIIRSYIKGLIGQIGTRQGEK